MLTTRDGHSGQQHREHNMTGTKVACLNVCVKVTQHSNDMMHIVHLPPILGRGMVASSCGCGQVGLVVVLCGGAGLGSNSRLTGKPTEMFLGRHAGHPELCWILSAIRYRIVL